MSWLPEAQIRQLRNQTNSAQIALRFRSALSDDLDDAGPTAHVVQARVISRRRCRSRSSNVNQRDPIPAALD